MASCSQSKIVKPATTFVPQWAESVIWYQIFPERFHNGDLNNDPTKEDIVGADPADPPDQWQIHPWASDWYELQPYEKANGDNELWKHLLRRRYGGDLQGVIDKLDYVQELGVTAIYLNPVFDSPSLHKYDAASYHHIDPNFGPDPDGDRALMADENPLDPSTWVWTSADELALTLIREAHKRKIRVIFDGVFNHMGIRSFAFRDLKEKQQESPYRDWFIVHSFDDPDDETEFEYQGWFGVKSLPEFKEDEMGIVAGPRDYIFDATRRWMNPKGQGIEHGIDGWRLDVAFNVHHNFWKAWRRLVKSVNPNAYITAEIVGTIDGAKPYLQGDEFDGEMNYNFAFTAAEFFFNPKEMDIKATEFDARLAEMRNLYPQGVAYVTQNLFGSHDSNRIGSHIVNRGIGNYRDWGSYFNTSQAAGNPEYDVSKPSAEDIRLQKLFVVFQMTYVGAPMVYYGDEVGMWGANDPDNRKPMIWADIQYQDEVYLPNGDTRPPDVVEVDADLLSHYKKLISIRRNNSALRSGSFESIVINDEKNIYGYERENDEQTIVVLLNNSADSQRVEVPLCEKKAKVVKDILNDTDYPIRDGNVALTLHARSGAILAADAKSEKLAC